MSAKVKTFEPLRDIRPHALREGITARAVEGERMTMAVVDLESLTGPNSGIFSGSAATGAVSPSRTAAGVPASRRS